MGHKELILNVDKFLCILNQLQICIVDRMLNFIDSSAPFRRTSAQLKFQIAKFGVCAETLN